MKERNYGIDALRIVAMFMIVMIHIMQAGGVMKVVNEHYLILNVFYLIVLSAVDIYGIISGYVAYSEDEKPIVYSKYLSLWMQVVTYSFGITIFAYVLKPSIISINQVIQSLFPVIFNKYWYFSSYTGVFFVGPYVNRLFRNCTKRESTFLIGVLFGLLSCCGTITSQFEDTFVLKNGYSFIWLLFLYCVGVWIKKIKLADYFGKNQIRSLLVLCAILYMGISVVIVKMNCDWITESIYINPITVLFAVVMVLRFSTKRVSKWKTYVVKLISPLTFGVYLIHVHEFVYGHFIVGKFAFIGRKSEIRAILMVVACAAIIFSVCLMIETIRRLAFKFLHIDDMIEKIYRRDRC